MRRDGFTLVEMLVVVMVLALAASAVVLTMRGGHGPSRDAAQLASRIAAARESAITSSRPVSVWVSRSGYGFEIFSGGRWQALDAKQFESRDWPRGTEVAATGMASDGGMASRGPARLAFDNLGLPEAPLAVRLTRNGESAAVEIAANGDVAVR